MSGVVDAHQHYWRSGEADQSAWRTAAHASIERDFTPADLAPDLARSGVDATVLVQSVDEAAENDRLAAFAAEAGTVAGVVGWLPLADPAAARAERERAGTDLWCGVRTLVGRDPLEWLQRPDVVALFRDLAADGLAWDVVPTTPEQVAAVVRLARAVPGLRVVVDHLARPPLDSGGWEPWAAQVAELAREPGVALKVSVGVDALTAWSSWRPEVLRPYVAHVLEHFGPGRLMLASNWPVVLLRAGHGRAWGDLRGAVAHAGAGPRELQDVLGGTAARWYALPAAVPAGTA
ncbi:amidohydrolase family protein [Kineococcus indalonis]|uniref:amidohydrolase family protein n=1 Tax=Kineococcus indalonis TaxID=2696566 RepID=UPI0014133B30|nr:amidohydrolase family protein [Kineococcus indalonis]NAZ85000.1 amidohydrolase family protein [Kineococcus indalonis]